MSWIRNTLKEIIERTDADMESRLPGTDARLRRNNVGVLSRILAGVAHTLYAYIDYNSKQILPDTADAETLQRHANLHGINRKTAANASGEITFTGVDGTVIPAATVLQRSDQVQFTIDSEVTINAGSVIANCTASEAGTNANTSAGSTLSLVSPLANVDTEATVNAEGITNGLETEADESLRERVIDKIQEPPHGGADFDYEKWAKEVPGVTRAWVYALELGLGTVVVRCVVDDHETSIIPDAAKVQEVQDYIETVRPVTASVTVVAPVAVPLDITISGLNPDTQTVRDAITAELNDLLRREAEPGGTILISHIREAISIAAGEVDHAVTSPVADVTHSTGEIATIGVITWV